MGVVHTVLARVFVADLDAALPAYIALTGDDRPRRFEFGDVELAWVGSFLLLRVPPGRQAEFTRAATLLTADIEAAAVAVRSHGGTVLEGPAPGPNGARMIARHADGAVFEYIESAP